MARVTSEEKASLLNRATFWWVIGVLKNFGGKDYKLSGVDLSKPQTKDASRELSSQLSRRWRRDQTKGGGSIFLCLLMTLGKDAIVAFPAILINIISLLVQPALVGEVVRYLQDTSHTTAYWAYIHGTAIVVLRVVTCLSTVHSFHPMFRLAMRARASLACLIYKKTLELKAHQLGKHGDGHIINLLSTDLEVVVMAFQFCSFLIIGPIVTIVCTGLIINEVGIISALPGIAVIIIIITIGVIFCKFQAKLRKAIASRTDKRIQVINEVISAIHVVKMYAWERYFLAEIGTLRKNELVKMFQRAILFTCNVAGNNSYHVMISMAVLLTFTYTGNALTSVLAIRVYGWSSIIAFFISIATVHTLRMVEAYRSIKRIEAFLLSDAGGIPTSPQEKGQISRSGGILLKDIKCTWNERENMKPEEANIVHGFSMSDINLQTNEGELVMVLGAVGSGKTTLLMTLLEELKLISGNMKLSENRSFSGETPWIFSASVKENILFKDQHNATKYQQVLDACCLRKDIESFSDGDSTHVGQNGLKLSGGQRARISLARAAYKDADIYLFDDPLSAVDSLVGHKLFHNCIYGMNDNKTRILATQNTDFVDMADKVIVFEKGKIVSSGKYEDIKQRLHRDFHPESKLPKNQLLSSESDNIDNESDEDGRLKVDSEALLADQYTSSIRQYWKYATSGNLTIYIIFISSLCINQALLYTTNWWLVVWSDKDVEYWKSPGNSTIAYSKEYYTGIYAIVTVSVVITAYLSIASTIFHAYRSSKFLHSGLIRRVLRAPMSFFDSTPVGNIVNNFSRDMGITDLIVPQQFMLSHLVGLKVLASIVFAAVVSPWSALSIPPFILLVAFIRWFAARGSKQYKRLESACKSPIYSHISNTLRGHTVIRAFNRQQLFIDQFHDLLDKHTSAWNTFICINRWMSLWVGMIFAVYIMILLIVSFLTSQTDANSGLVGFSLIHTILCVEVLTFFTETATDLENHLTAIGRIQSSSEIEQEGPYETEQRVPDDWPACGDIVLNNVSLKYPTSPSPSITNLSVMIRNKEKIGIVGRTGAGKSSVMRAMLRLTEPEGAIMIDSVNVQNIGLDDLRSNITVIPQDPVIFSGTVRRNLDLWAEHGDDKLWGVLKQTQLDSYIRNLSAGLETDVGAGGSIFSAGQKQLVCLTRALLRDNKILLIDEATANVDHQTDKLIQATIKEKLSHCTVLTIAHRIQTVMDSDKIMVMEDGKLVEFNTPQTLLNDKESYLYKLVIGVGQ